MTDRLQSKNLVPFKKRRGAYSIPGMSAEGEDHSLDHVDQNLSPEEQRFIRHYVGYADTLLKSVPEQEFPRLEDTLENTSLENKKTAELPAPELPVNHQNADQDADQDTAKDEAA